MTSHPPVHLLLCGPELTPSQFRRVDQQLAVMEMLDNLMLTGCSMSHRQTPLTLQTSNPTFLTQMTISRGLGPQMYSKVGL